MDLSFFFKGLIFGFSIAAPVGPIGILCIRRSLSDGWLAGLLTGLGAATADACYGCVAGFGLAGISGFLVDQQVWLQLFGGLFLCWLGLRIFLSDADGPAAENISGNAAMGYLSALFLTLTNPMTILAFAAVFAGMGLGSVRAAHSAVGCLVAGVFAGSMAWWVILSSTSSLFSRRMNATAMRWINRFSGVVLVGFGAIVVIGRF
ncbi:lysine transporter LysE [Desulfosarcina alkanivorans]|uniref:Lysine transporter LysE n=1 Tax=Desulfosarcina alkanivorans TaxID=571177 RepID=A0A5K7YTL6_9BACT|nr:LysE family translocator [Desulfosarcina alkanivorans]BBO71978.1 lysine transporter LysE [Desulfosarcina alkanivorans]